MSLQNQIDAMFATFWALVFSVIGIVVVYAMMDEEGTKSRLADQVKVCIEKGGNVSLDKHNEYAGCFIAHKETK